MNISNILSIDELRVATYDRSSKLAHEFPGKQYFSERTDLIQLGHTDHIAVLIRLSNLRAKLPWPIGVNTTLKFNILDDGMMLATQSLAVRMRQCDDYKEARVDIFVELNRKRLLHKLDLQIEAPDGTCLRTLPLRIYNMMALKLLPTKFFKIHYGSLQCGEEECPLQTPGDLRDEHRIYIDFLVTPQVPAEVELPATELMLLAPDGHRQILHPLLESRDGNSLLRCAVDIDPAAVKGVYYAELSCLGYAFAGMVFATCGTREDGWRPSEILHATRGCTTEAAEKRFEQEGIGRLESEVRQLDQTEAAATETGEITCLEQLVGITSVKKRIAEYAELMRFNRLRQAAGLPGLKLPLHAMFLGSPGTGKTTVAKLLGRKLKELGVLSSGHVVVRERANLIGKYYNSEAESTLAALEEARGGILFIDEAYQLNQPDDPKDPGRFVLECLLTAMADPKQRDWMLILAGYDQPMKRLLDLNPGLRSRIPDTNIYTFDDFDADELLEVGRRYLERYGFRLDTEAEQALGRRLAADYASRRSDFGNARHVENLLQTGVIPAMAMRLAAVAGPDADTLSLIKAQDIPAPLPRFEVTRRRLGFAV